MSRPPWPGLVASLVLHAVLVAAALAVLPRSEPLPALFVDLTAADPSEGRRGPTFARPRAVARSRAPAHDSARPRASEPRVAMPSIPERPPDSSATISSPDPSAAAPEAPAPIPVPSSPPESLPAPAAFPADAAAEPEPPAASAAPDSGGPAPPEALPGRTGGGSALGDPAASDEAAFSGSVAAARDLSGPRPGGDAASEGAGVAQELARRSPTGEGDEAPQAVYTEYLERLRQRVHEALRYPRAARRRGLAGAVTIELTILPSGVIRDVSIVQSSSHPLLDDAAVETVQELRAQPFPPGVAPRTLRVRLPVVFRLQ